MTPAGKPPLPRALQPHSVHGSPAPGTSGPRLLTPTDIFNESLAYVPMMHVPVTQNQHVLVIGNDALAAVSVAVRYPTFAEILVVGDPTPEQLRDPRVHAIPRLADLPRSWKADLIVVALPNIVPDLLQNLRLHSTQRTIVVVASSTPERARPIKDAMRQLWPMVMPYREHLPDASFFVLASDLPLARHRAIPPGARRLTDKYLPSLFTFAKDEYALLYGAVG